MKLRRVTKAVSWMMVFILCAQILMPTVPMIAKASSIAGEEAGTLKKEVANFEGVQVTSGGAISVGTKEWPIKQYEPGFHIEPDTGMTIVQSPHLPNYYQENYWNTLDKNKLPGTTALAANEVNVASGSSIVLDSVWMGAKLDATHFINAIQLKNEVNAQKSYFSFENQMACLGAGINNVSIDTGKEVHTIIDNYKFDDTAKDKANLRYSSKTIEAWGKNFFPLGNTFTYYDSTLTGNLMSNRHWALLLPSGSPVGIGYYFKESEKELNLRFIESADALNNKKTYLQLWLNHGTIRDAVYDYSIFKDLNAADAAGTIRDYMTKNKAVTIANTKDIQASFYGQTNTVAANIWAVQGGTVTYNAISNFTVNAQSSIMMRKNSGLLEVAVSDPTGVKQGTIEIVIDSSGYEVVSKDSNITTDLTVPGKIKLIVDVTGLGGATSKITINTIPPAVDSNVSSIDIVKGNSVLIPTPDGFIAPVTWTTIFKNADGNPIKNVGSSKKKDELKPGETDGNRVEGVTLTSHIASIEGIAEGGLISTYEKGIVYAKAVDKEGNTKEWKVNVLFTAKENLPTVTPQDYQNLRAKWSSLLVGQNLDQNDTVIMETVNNLNVQAQEIWNRYSYKGQPVCGGIPWKDEEGKKGNPNIEYQRDAVEFRPAFQNLLTMAKAYRVEHGALYHNQALLQDMIQILDWLTTNCYRPQSETDNWWTWEIGIPKDLIPTLILLSDELTKEQKENYTKAIVFFQPDPYHGGAIGTGSTHVEGYRMQYAANRVDNSVTAMGLGLLLEENEFMYLAQLASSSVLEFVSVKDSALLARDGFENGFYTDGSYIDHSRTPYAGSYGVVVLEGVVNISAILSNSPWQYSADKTDILETILLNTYGISVYNGLMLDMLRGRAVGRENVTGRTIGRQVMTNAIKSLDSVGTVEKKILSNYLKNWLLEDPEYVSSLKELNEIYVKQKAMEILNDASISGIVPSVHQNFPLMDRAIHRTNDWLFALSMYSERIFNTEIMNGENLYGWHQSDGMTYLYQQDNTYYIDNFWNTINPFRLPGTTTVSKNIGNGVKDSSGFYQGGDYASKEDWVGGSMLSDYGVNGMSLSGENDSATPYEPNLRALKSYFMFEDEIVCLGAGVSDSGSNYITETTVENRKLNETASNQITWNGNNLDLSLVSVNVADIVAQEGLGTGTASMEGTPLANTEWIHMEGTTPGEEIGWYFPSGTQQLKVRKVASTGNWGNINITPSKDVVKNYFELWFDHGKNPQNAEYAYVMLPGKSTVQMKEYAKKPSVEILANTTDVQAVSYQNKSVIGANFWQDKLVTVDGISCDKKASLIMKQTGDVLEIGVSDPTMKNVGTIEIELDKEYVQLISADPNVTVSSVNQKIHLSVNTSQKNGSTSYAVIKVKNTTTPTPTPSVVPTITPTVAPTQTPAPTNAPVQPENNVNSGVTVTESVEESKKQITITAVTTKKDENNNEVIHVEETVKDLITGTIIEVRKQVAITDAKTGEKVETKLLKDANGKIVDALVYADGISSKKEVNKTAANFTVQVAKETIHSVITQIMEGESADIVFDLKLSIPTESYQEELKKLATIKEVNVNLVIPLDLEKEGRINISDILMKKELLQSMKEKSADLNLSVQDEKQKIRYSWSMDGKELRKSQESLNDINFSLGTVSMEDSKPMSELMKEKDGVVISFAHQGKLPAAATVKINDTENLNFAKNQKLYVYYYNEKEHRVEETIYEEGKSLGKGVIEFKIAHCSDYVVVPKKLDEKLVVSLAEQVSVASELKLMLGEKQRVIVNAPESAQITYGSSNPKVATVYRNGMVRGNQKGEAVIQVTVKIKGKISVYETKVRVKN